MNSVTQILGWALVHALWQGCLLALLAAIAGLFLQGRLRHGANVLALGLCLLLPSATALRFHGPVPSGWEPAPVESAARTVAPVRSAAMPRSVPPLVRLEAALQPHLPILVVLWALGASLMGLRLGGGYALALCWKRRAAPVSERWQGLVDDLVRRIGLRRSVPLCVAGQGSSPVVVGIWKPVILVPAALLTSLPPPYLEALLAHELAHVRRMDPLWALLQSLVEALLFFHPAVWWLSARIRAEREELADQVAARLIGDPRRLAQALDALDDLQPPVPSHPLFAALAARGGHLLTRIERLLSPRPATASPWGLPALLLIPCLALALRAAAPGQPPIGAPAETLAQLDALAAKEGLDPQLLRSMAWVESGFNAKAKSPMGATGLLQVMPETARTYGAKNLDDPAQVMAAGAKYLRFLLDRYHGDTAKAVAAYNCGEQALDAGRITEEATRYRVLVLDVFAAKAVQPEAPLADGEVQGVLRMHGTTARIQLRIRAQSLDIHITPEQKDGNQARVQVGALLSESQPNGTFRYSAASQPWMDHQPNVLLDVSKAGNSLLVHVKDPSTGWTGETRVPLDAPWKTFSFQMKKP
jgi:soluble lytic murein transglycosylase-like protein